MKTAALGELIKWLDKIGWKKGYVILEMEHKRLESKQAYLWSDPSTYSQAEKLSPTLLKQDETLIKLQALAEEKGWVLR